MYFPINYRKNGYYKYQCAKTAKEYRYTYRLPHCRSGDNHWHYSHSCCYSSEENRYHSAFACFQSGLAW